MATIQDAVAYVIQTNPTLPYEALHNVLFHASCAMYLETGTPLFPDVAVALPSGAVFPALDAALGAQKWRRRYEARFRTRGRRDARRIPAQ